MKPFIAILFIGILFFSCGDEKKEIVIPNDVISKEKFSNVLIDILVIEGYRSRVNKSNLKKDDELRSFYLGAFEKHGITKSEFENSYNFYSDYPQEFEKIMRNAEQNFKLLEDRIIGERNKKEPVIIPDSIPRKRLLNPGLK